MALLKLGSQIGQTVRNVGRLRTIVGVFARHGFDEIVNRMTLSKYIPFKIRRKREEIKKSTAPQRLKMCFEELGPTFVKLGQLLSTRPDMIPPEYCNEFKKLQDDVAPLEFSKMQPVIEKELNQPISHVFKEFGETPFASASIGQVYTAKLKNDTDVVVKVQRPHIARPIHTDVQLLKILAELMEKYVPETTPFNPKGVVNEFERSLKQELNFNIEANNMIRIAENMKGFEEIIIPQVFKEFSTTKLLIQERIKGIRFSDVERIRSQGVDIKKLTHAGIQAFYKQVMIDGLFHGDLHAGNLFVTDEGKLGVIDFGIVGHLTKATREALTNMLLCLISEDYETLVYEFLDIGTQKGKVNVSEFQRQIKTLLEPYYGMPLKDFNVGKLLLDLMVCASQNNIQVSQDLVLVSKAILTIEGMGKELDPDFDLLEEMTIFSKEIFKDRYNLERLGKEAIWVLRDFTGVFKLLPRFLKHHMRRQSSEEYAQKIEIENLEKAIEKLQNSQKYNSSLIFCSALVLSSSLFIIHKVGPSLFEFSLFGMTGLGFSLVLALWVYLRS